jgi:TolA-binding protein
MTTTTLTNDIATLKAAMAPVQKLADQLTALQAAVAELAGMQAKLKRLEAQLASEQEAERVQAAIRKRYAITAVVPNQERSARVSAMTPFSVLFTERMADEYGRPAQREGRMALNGLTSELWSALLADPDKLPAVVRALDSDPDAAVHKYCANIQRGYIRG